MAIGDREMAGKMGQGSMIIADFFTSQAELDAFIMSLPLLHVARISNGVLRVFKCTRIVHRDRYTVEFYGATLVKNIYNPNVQEQVDILPPPVKKRHHH
jgi:hypothetical protein